MYACANAAMRPHMLSPQQTLHLSHQKTHKACNVATQCVGALKALSTHEDSRPRVIKATKEWYWRPLVSVLEHEDVSVPFTMPSLPHSVGLSSVSFASNNSLPDASVLSPRAFIQVSHAAGYAAVVCTAIAAMYALIGLA